ncbi:MAG: hypothetical protein GX357_02585 [Firmicutes bacterium]|nr:hypothetical protein [Bacillota bacterium]
METMPVITLALLAFPEGILAPSLGLVLLGQKPRLKTAVLIGLIYMVGAFIARRLLLYGLHSIGLLVLVVFIILHFYNLPLKAACAASIIAYAFIILGESLTLPLFMRIFSVTIEEILADTWLRVAASLPNQILLLLVFCCTYYIRGFHKKNTKNMLIN